MLDRVLTDPQLLTLFTEVESIVYSQPLTHISHDIDDLSAARGVCVQRPGTGHVCLKGWGGSPAKIEHFPKVPNTLRGWVPHGKMHRR